MFMKSKIGIQITSLISAIVASSCCWLPFVLLFFGLSTSTMGSFLSKYSIPLNVAALILLGFGFYLQYIQKKAPKECCEPNKSSKIEKFSEISLWITTIIVIGFLTLPMYMKFLPLKKSESSCDTDLINKIENLENRVSEKNNCCPN